MCVIAANERDIEDCCVISFFSLLPLLVNALLKSSSSNVFSLLCWLLLHVAFLSGFSDTEKKSFARFSISVFYLFIYFSISLSHFWSCAAVSSSNFLAMDFFVSCVSFSHTKICLHYICISLLCFFFSCSFHSVNFFFAVAFFCSSC